MCLAVPGELIRIDCRVPAGLAGSDSGPGNGDDDASLWRIGLVDFCGVQREVSLACLPEARVGDHLLVHVGFALSVVEP